MSYWAQVNADNIVLTTSVSQSDEFGAEWLSEKIGGRWIEYWKDGGQRKNPAGAGHTYDEERDAFIPPKPFDSWILDEETCLWVAPVPMPEETDEEGNPVPYVWDETAGEWVVSE